MRAFVLSGGGNRGAFQVGALRALLERKIFPDMIVGCSAGALNAAFLAREISLARLDKLLMVWRNTTKDHIYPGNQFSVLWRLVSGQDSLYDNRNFYEFLQRAGNTPAVTFGDIPNEIPLYITATHLDTEQLHVFGDDPHDRILDALMASTALPPMHPPWLVNGERYIDGGTVTPLPLRVAMERGATEIFALHIWEEPQPMGKLSKGVAAIINRSINTMLRFQAQHDLLLTEVHSRRLHLHEIRLHTAEMPDIHDRSQADRLAEAGYELTKTYLDQIYGHDSTADVASQPALQRIGQFLAQGWSRLTTATQAVALPRLTPPAENLQTLPVRTVSSQAHHR